MMDERFMKELLDGVEIQWKTLGDEKNVSIENAGRKPIKSSLRLPGDVPYYGANNIQDYVKGYTHDGVFILIAEDGSASLDNYSIQLTTGKFWANNHVHVLKCKENLNIRFLYYFLNTVNFIPFLSGGTRAKLTKVNLKKIEIPIPPLDIQEKIVEILDNFTELTTELTAELTARKKQYEYYRDELLTFDDNEVEWKKLGDVCNLIYGYSTKANDFGEARFIRISDINSNGKLMNKDFKFVDITEDNKKYILKKNDLLMARTGATYGKTMIFEENYKAVFAGYLIKLNFDKDIILQKYYWHFSQSSFFWNQADRLASGGGQPQFNANVLKEVKIPIPSLEEQERIVSILDKFDTLTSSITEGLPREIELRQKQYEYYRDMLLNFPKEKEDK